MPNIMSHTEWERAADHGTSGDMVHDILASWKADNARLRELLEEARGMLIRCRACAHLHWTDESYNEVNALLTKLTAELEPKP